MRNILVILKESFKFTRITRSRTSWDNHIQAAKVATIYFILKVSMNVLLHSIFGGSIFLAETVASGLLGVLFVGYLSYLVFVLYSIVDNPTPGPPGLKGPPGRTGLTGRTGPRGPRGGSKNENTSSDTGEGG